jgi:hypothetical protein
MARQLGEDFRRATRNIRGVTQGFVIASYLLAAIWCLYWLLGGSNNAVLWLTFGFCWIAAVILLLAYRTMDYRGFRNLLPWWSWGVLMVLMASIIWESWSLNGPSQTGIISTLGAMAPLFVRSLDDLVVRWAKRRNGIRPS